MSSEIIQKAHAKAESVSTGTWRLVLGLLLTGMLSLFGWSLYETVSIGKVTIKRSEFVQHEKENRDDFKETQQIIRKQQDRTEQKIDKIRELLIRKLGE